MNETRVDLDDVDEYEETQQRFEAWVQAATVASGQEVVAICSGAPFIRDWPTDRIVGILNRFLNDGCPVYLQHPGPELDGGEQVPDSLRFDCPPSRARSMIDRLLEADVGEKRKLLFVTFPDEVTVRRLVTAKQHGWTIVYDIQTDWGEVSSAVGADWHRHGSEWYLMKEADLVTAVSEALALKVSAVFERKDVYTVRNAVDQDRHLPARRQAAGPLIIGCIGKLGPDSFDWSLVVETAERYPSWRFHLPGPATPRNVTLPGNVELIDSRERGDTAEVSRTWSGAILPLTVSRVTAVADPVEAYECLNLGLPVVSSYVSQLRGVPGVVVTESRGEFIDEVGNFSSRMIGEETVAWLNSNRWQDRIDEYRRLVNEADRATRGIDAILRIP